MNPPKMLSSCFCLDAPQPLRSVRPSAAAMVTLAPRGAGKKAGLAPTKYRIAAAWPGVPRPPQREQSRRKAQRRPTRARLIRPNGPKGAGTGDGNPLNWATLKNLEEMSDELQSTGPRRYRLRPVRDARSCASFLRHVRCRKEGHPGRHREGIPVDQSAQLDPDDRQQRPGTGRAMGDRDGRTERLGAAGLGS